MKFGYARGGADDGDLTGQRRALEEAGCMAIFADEESGVALTFSARDRCLAMPRRGDTLVVCELDRLGFRLDGLATLLDDFDRRGVGFISLREAIDTRAREGRAVRRTIGVLAVMDYAVVAARVVAGKQAAWERAVGPNGGHRLAVTPEQVIQARELFEGEGRGLREIAGIFGVGETTLRHALARAGVALKREHRGKMTPEMLARARGLLGKGMSVAEIGQVMNLRPNLLYKAFRRAGVTVIRRRRRKITPEMLVRARDLIEQGTVPAEAARLIGVSHGTLRATLRREGVKVRLKSGPRAKVTPEKLARARALIDQGKSQAEAAKAIGVGLWSFRAAIRRAGVVVRYRHRRWKMTPSRLARARELIDQGKSETAAAKIIGVGATTLSRVLREEEARETSPPDGD
jgi:DNA invertase Pin-like site-specific DNA recombinase